jgi:hypothetical protein
MTDPAPFASSHEPPPSLKVLFGIIPIAAACVLSGLAGHDPWKRAATYSFGGIYNMCRAADFVVPVSGGATGMVAVRRTGGWGFPVTRRSIFEVRRTPRREAV